ncbi:uncharacterized protein GGS22DRAFT_144556 [Annulohypoxylon maeteangense]|uniref:uncharacterized protein n=1 Tax=Annulohypoxylon maeteangense TaxID=1927788 RepID=UPI0020073B4A|nr:uncharacterized protein GGS22DRAFT_144556 [Annulohypoxylon maeteangense]KAI0884600.1 hypothetical protein GGS22DRAFT_144556 [Annulohypoxylon maeteangense]
MAIPIFSWIKYAVEKISRYFYTEPKQETEPGVTRESEVDLEPETSPRLIDDPPLFPLFSALPVELQLMIWEAASELHEAGICIPTVNPEYRGLSLGVWLGLGFDIRRASEHQEWLNDIVGPLVVNCKLPPIFHVCKQSRDIARRNIDHHEDDIGACYGAFRIYDPEKDIFFVTYDFFEAFRVFFFWDVSREIKHIGIEPPTSRSTWLYYFLSCWNHSVARCKTPKVTIIYMDRFDFGDEVLRPVFRVRKLFTTGKEIMACLLRGWYLDYAGSNDQASVLSQDMVVIKDPFEVTFGMLMQTGSEPLPIKMD